jgi:hypothetical protein
MMTADDNTEHDDPSLIASNPARPWETGQRIYPRWYFHDPEVPLAEQSSGITGVLKKPGVLFDTHIGSAIIKDLSLGGIGFIAPRRYQVPKRVVVVVGRQYPLVCEIIHRRPVDRSLVFYGAKWHRMDRRLLMLAISRYARFCNMVC